MDPQQPNQPPATPPTAPPSPLLPPQLPEYTPPVAPGEPAKPKSHTKLALVLLIGPTALFIAAIICYAVMNFIIGSTESSTSTELFTEPNPVKTVLNVLLFLAGAISVLTWLPGIIIGIVLLAKKK